MREWLLAVNTFIQLNGQRCGRRVMMVGCGNKHRVDVLADFVIHDPVIGKDLEFIGVLLLILQPLFDLGVAFLVRIDNRHKVFLARVDYPVQVIHAAPAATNLHALQLVPWDSRCEQVWTRQSGGGQGRWQSGRHV